ncbi:hypothetical protein [Hydrogenophaga sp.]|uniref:hypothetical protein n=1 Tax=Hydrogenophaga sp. TaxID=1904254 RepID=UPI00272FFCA3|nr:hypothetical protein [Hydrogenophaga sp.]MDP2017124.1 hypothetical protein [Hydrogenophaga sp.]
MRHTALTLCLVAAASLLPGCDALGVESASQIAAKKEAEGKAIGSACRHAVRSIEDCFGGYPRAGKAAVFAGWKEMDEYMRENAIVGMPADHAPAEAAPAVSPKAPDGGKPANASRTS